MEVTVADNAEFLAVVSEQTTGGHVWDAAIHLLQFFEARPELLGGRPSVLELGAGTGFLGMTLSTRFDLHQMVLTEMVQGGALEWLDHNVARNREAGLPLADVRTAALDWSWIGEESSAGEDGQRALAELLSTEWDVVIGSDLVYNEVGVEMLPRVVGALARGRTRIFYAHTLNRFEFFDRDFFEALAAAGVACTEVWPADKELVTDFGSAQAGATRSVAGEQEDFSGELFPDMRVIVIEMTAQQPG